MLSQHMQFRNSSATKIPQSLKNVCDENNFPDTSANNSKRLVTMGKTSKTLVKSHSSCEEAATSIHLRAVLRSLGDGDLKSVGLTAQPELMHFQLTSDDEFLVRAVLGLSYRV